MYILGWKYYNHAAVPTSAPHENVDISPIDNGTIWSLRSTSGSKPLLARYITDFDCKEPLMYYRQHGGNVVGSQTSFFRTQWNRVLRYTKSIPHQKSLRCKWALAAIGSYIPEDNKQLLLLGATYRDDIKVKFRLLGERRIYNNGVIENIGLFFMILLNRF